jgi:hypothetical protein
MKDVDKVVEQHGGWPDAFCTSPSSFRKAANLNGIQ